MPGNGATSEQGRSRNWCFTMNNPGLEEVAALDRLAEVCRYMVVGNEYGESGTHHFQGYVMMPNAMRRNTMRAYSGRAHWEIAKGTWEEASDYCKEDGDFIEYGTKPMTRKRKGERGAEEERQRWKRIRELSKVADYVALEDEFPRELTLYEGQLRRLAMANANIIDLAAGTVCGIWIYGPSGSGKTYHAVHNIGDRRHVYLKNLNKWWDGYDQLRHRIVVVDDMDPYHKAMARDFKVWTQEYEFNAEFKGGYMTIRPQMIVVTSNYRIHEIWDDAVTRSTMERRFKKCMKQSRDEPVEPDTYYEDIADFAQHVPMSLIDVSGH